MMLLAVGFPSGATVRLGSLRETESIPLTEYCRVFLGQRRGAKRLEDILKGSRRGGELKIDWTKPLPRA
jgi:hypothetical protein